MRSPFAEVVDAESDGTNLAAPCCTYYATQLFASWWSIRKSMERETLFRIREGRGERGATMIEYVLLASLLSITLIPIMSIMTHGINNTFDTAQQYLIRSGDVH